MQDLIGLPLFSQSAAVCWTVRTNLVQILTLGHAHTDPDHPKAVQSRVPGQKERQMGSNLKEFHCQSFSLPVFFVCTVSVSLPEFEDVEAEARPDGGSLPRPQ